MGIENPKSNVRIWIEGILLWGAVGFVLWWLAGCSIPGGAGFRQLADEQRKERTALKAVAVHSSQIDQHAARIQQHADRIGQHTAAAQKYAGMLEATTLTKQQAEWLHDLTVELKATQGEKAALALQVGDLKAENSQLLAAKKTVDDQVTQRDATIRQTKAEVAAAEHEAFFARLWLRIEWFFIGALTLFVAQVAFRVTKGGMKLAAAVAVV